MYRTEPPTDKTIREWYMKFQQSGCLCAAKRRGRAEPQSSSEVPEGLMNNPVLAASVVVVIIMVMNIETNRQFRNRN